MSFPPFAFGFDLPRPPVTRAGASLFARARAGWWLGALCAFGSAGHPGSAFGQADATGWVDDMARPLENGSDHYPRNAWDLHLWQGRIYVGWGNSAFGGPSPNHGPVSILSFSPGAAQWAVEHMTNDSQVDVFKELDGRLVVPGHDQWESFARGSFYRLADSGWERKMSFTNIAHCYDMHYFDGRYWAAIGTSTGAELPSEPMGCFRQSSDDGETWADIGPFRGRLYNVFDFQGVMYSTGSVFEGFGGPAVEFRNEQWAERTDLTPARIFPGGQTVGKVHRSVKFNNRLLYLGGQSWNDHQTNPFGAYSAASWEPGAISVSAISLPAAEKPWDLLVRGGKAYLLTSEKLATTPETFRIRVRQSTNGTTFAELLRFTEWTFARSFELHEGSFYFGLGTDVGSDYNNAVLASYTATRSPFSGYLRRVPADVSNRTLVVVDNADSARVTLTGTWLSSTNTIGYIGGNYIHDDKAGKGSKSVRYTPDLPLAGFYEVAIRYSSASARATNVPVTIAHRNGSAAHSVNQTQSANGIWKVLGSYEFDAGTAGNVLVSNAGTSSYVTADAVAFRRLPEGSYGEWAARRGLNGTPGREPRFSANADSDGAPNGLEAVLAGDPLASDPAVLPGLEPAAGGFAFRFFRDDASEGFAGLACEWSTDLQTRQAVPVGAAGSGPDAQGIAVEVEENGAAPDSVTVFFPAALAPQGKLFAWLKADLLVP